MSPVFITLIRFTIASLVLVPFYFGQKPEKINSKDLWFIVSRSVFFSFNLIIFSFAIQYTTAIASQIIYSFGPIFVVILSRYMLGEKLTINKIIGLVLAIIGLIFLMEQSFGRQSVITFGTPLGNLLTLLAVLSWSLYLVFSKPLTQKYSPITTSFMSFVTTVVLLIPLVFVDMAMHTVIIKNFTVVSVASVVILGAISSALMFFLIQYGVKKTTAFTASLQQYIGPFAAAITAIPILGEKPTISFVFGGLLVLIGVFYATTYEYVKRQMKSMLQ